MLPAIANGGLAASTGVGMSGSIGPLPDALAPAGIPARSKVTLPKILVALVAAAVGWFGVQALTSVDRAPRVDTQVGDCLALSGSLDFPQSEEVACSDGRATAVVTEVPSRDEVGARGIAGHCDPMEDDLYFKDDAPTLPAGMCLRMNASAGECWALSETAFPDRVACNSDGDVVVKVEGVHVGAAVDPGLCSEDALSLILVKRLILYCLAPVSVSPEFEEQQDRTSSTPPADL